MALILEVDNPIKYIRALSGLFINSKSPEGLTPKEMQLVSLIMTCSKNGKGIMNKDTKQKVMEESGLKKQSFYNAMSSLRKKGALIGNSLNKVLISSQITIKHINEI